MKKNIQLIAMIVSVLLMHCFDENPVGVLKKTVNAGNGIKKISQYSPRGELEYSLTFIYDENGRKKELQHHSPSSQLIGTYSISYSKEGTISKQSLYMSSGDTKQYTGSHTFEYDSNGNEIKMSILDPSDNLQEYFVSEYDRAEKLVKESVFSASGDLQKYYIYDYDDSGVNIYNHCYLASGELYSSSRNTYDAEGRIVKESVEYNKKVIYYLTYEY